MKKIFKNFVNIILAASLAISSLGITGISKIVVKAETVFEFTALEDGTAEVKGASNVGNVLQIPTATPDGTKVSSIANSAFQKTKIKELIIPEGITNIGRYAFRNCEMLEKASLPSTVKSMKMSAFYGCSALSEVNMADGFVPGNGTFQYCTSLKSVKLPSGLEKLPNSIFNGCSSLESVEIPSSVTSIETKAFNGCLALSVVKVPSSVQTIAADAFKDCGTFVDDFDNSRYRDFTLVSSENSPAKQYAETDSGAEFMTDDEYADYVRKMERVKELLSKTTTTTTTAVTTEFVLPETEKPAETTSTLVATTKAPVPATTSLLTTKAPVTTTKKAAQSTAPVKKYKKGDANHDDKITSEDATLILITFAENLTVSNPKYYPEYDYNSDKKITAEDATGVLIYYSKKLVGLV